MNCVLDEKTKLEYNKVLNELKKGEPFSFIRSGRMLCIGTRSKLDDEHDEIEIFITHKLEDSICIIVKKKKGVKNG